MRQIIKLDPDGTTTLVEVDDTPLSLGLLQSLVGGYIQTMVMMHDNLLVFDEEGRIKDLPINSRIPCLVGTVLVVKRMGHEMHGIPPVEAAILIEIMDNARKARAAGLN